MDGTSLLTYAKKGWVDVKGFSKEGKNQFTAKALRGIDLHAKIRRKTKINVCEVEYLIKSKEKTV